MAVDKTRQNLLRRLPGVDRLLEAVKLDPFFDDVPKSVLVRNTRRAVDVLRKTILEGDGKFSGDALSEAAVISRIKIDVKKDMALNLAPVVNATGIVVHTNLGRSALAGEAIENLQRVAMGYSNLEFDLARGRRGSRYAAVEDILCEISGAESAMVVNNNAGAVLLCLESLARGKPVIVSRGELVEIGGAFRIPDVMAKSGAILREVGTTNRTHLKDYARAIDDDTALLMKVHKSNYSVVGFTAEVSLGELVELGREKKVPVLEDLGSGMFIDFSVHGLIREPTVQDSVKAGADVVTFSGDKLLGGPQAGIIVGKRNFIDEIRQNPITRALRIDKLTLAALESTLRLYRDPEKALQTIPTLRMLTQPLGEIEHRTRTLLAMLDKLDDRISVEITDLVSRVGGGALPLQELPSKGLHIRVAGIKAGGLERMLRANLPPIIGRIEDDRFLMDLRTMRDDELPAVESAFRSIMERPVS